MNQRVMKPKNLKAKGLEFYLFLHIFTSTRVDVSRPTSLFFFFLFKNRITPKELEPCEVQESDSNHDKNHTWVSPRNSDLSDWGPCSGIVETTLCCSLFNS